MRVIRKLLTTLGIAFLFVSVAGAQGTEFHATLSGKNSVPAVDTMAQGQATFRLSKDGKRLIYRLSVTNIKDVSMAHIHLAAAGENGPVVVWLYPSKPPAMVKTGMFSGLLARGTITAANLTGPLKGKSIADLVDELKMGKTYVNVHTKEHPEGEIRGQIE